MTDTTTPTTFVTNSVTLATANTAIQAAIAKAEDMGLTVTVAIVDPHGTLKAYQRMEGSSQLSTEVAMRKAYTAATSGFNTGGFFEFIKGDEPLLHGMPQVPGYSIFGGGERIEDDKLGLIGAVGVSGAHYSEDEQIALAGVAAALGR